MTLSEMISEGVLLTIELLITKINIHLLFPFICKMEIKTVKK